jgi:hypothetical protein
MGASRSLVTERRLGGKSNLILRMAVQASATRNAIMELIVFAGSLAHTSTSHEQTVYFWR